VEGASGGDAGELAMIAVDAGTSGIGVLERYRRLDKATTRAEPMLAGEVAMPIRAPGWNWCGRCTGVEEITAEVEMIAASTTAR
jgi:hypothetical protein